MGIRNADGFQINATEVLTKQAYKHIINVNSALLLLSCGCPSASRWFEHNWVKIPNGPAAVRRKSSQIADHRILSCIWLREITECKDEAVCIFGTPISYFHRLSFLMSDFFMGKYIGNKFEEVENDKETKTSCDYAWCMGVGLRHCARGKRNAHHGRLFTSWLLYYVGCFMYTFSCSWLFLH